MSDTQGDTEAAAQHGEAIPDFALAIYRGCVLPEDYRPIRITTWAQWTTENPDDYNPDQLTLIRQRLLEGKSWVCFMKTLETICCPESYIRQPPYNNPVKPKDRVA